MQPEEVNTGISLAEEVTEILRERIIKGDYAMGEKLTESRIADELKVSRTPVRDAFAELEKEQLIEHIPHKGCFARGLTREDVADIYAVRKAVESMAIQRAVDRADIASLKRMKEELENLRQYMQHYSHEQLLDSCAEFQRILHAMSGSRFIVQALDTYHGYVHYAQSETLKREDCFPEIYREHEAIYRALESRDKEAAVRAVQAQIDESARRALAWGYDR